ncbi:MFS transporter [Leeia sp. TBRC 13508]|uniref:MFS transporter n=1 Tax=Leeia speluncae TaxID=2884804 RepID=A0ABS8D9G2_9NEIS|nr:MFS transporter [Leeia speluncae]MCB6184854.1 MFS transporter [Leeia speluncae]
MSEPVVTRSNPHQNMIMYLVAGAFFMENLDATVLVTAIPAMAKAFHVTAFDMNIGITAYLVVLTLLIPASGWIADRFGTRRVFFTSIGLFTLASACCAMAPSLTWFAIFRGLQGAAGALMVPVGRLAVLKNTPKEQLLRATAMITWPGLVAPVIGPPLGGLIVQYIHWEWIFYLNIPLGIVFICLIFRFFPDTHTPHEKGFDLSGFLLSCGFNVGLIYSLDAIAELSHWPTAIASVLLTAWFLWAFIRHCQNKTHAIINWQILQHPTYRLVVTGGTLFRISLNAAPFLFPLILQLGMGISPFQSGLLMLVMFGGNLLMKSLIRVLVRKFGFRPLLLGGVAVSIGIYQLMAWIGVNASMAVIVLILFGYGISRSVGYTVLSTLAFSDVDDHHMTDANTLLNMLLRLSNGVGVAFTALVLKLSVFAHPNGGHLFAYQMALVALSLLGVFALVLLRKVDKTAGEGIVV